MKLSIFILFLTALSLFIPSGEFEDHKIKAAKIEFLYQNSRSGEKFEGTNYFDNFGEKTLTVFQEKRSTDLLKILKRDSLEYNFYGTYWGAVERTVDILIDPIIELNGTDSYSYCGAYSAINRRDTVFNKMNCSVYDIVCRWNKNKGILVTFNNIKMYYSCDFDDVKYIYTVIGIDSTNSKVKAELFEIPK